MGRRQNVSLAACCFYGAKLHIFWIDDTKLSYFVSANDAKLFFTTATTQNLNYLTKKTQVLNKQNR
ncbi:hypothetical protein SDC9_103121 [bioreactor metagenome]|uniref:Uncharacterized protein n=1 Tax=bioreactor metagenome TaxID=1076179 RepID=A0A645ATB3_9ZZZZ